MFKKIYIGLGILWLLTISGLLAVGFGPVLFPTKAVNVAAAHLSEEGNTPVQEESSLERMSDPLPLAGAGFTLLLTLLVSSLRYYAGNQQEGAARTAAGRARHYLVTLATEEEVKQDKIESFWFGVRRGMQVGWWEEMTGRSPYLIWTYLGSRHSAYPYGIYLTVVGEKRVQDSIGMALKSLNPTLEVRQLESNPRVVIGKYARRYLSIKLGRSAYLPIKTDFGKEYNPLVALFKHLEPRGGVEQVGVDILMRPARPGWSNAGLSKVKHTREKEANKKAAAKTEANKSLASGVENKLKADAHGWNCYFVVYASGQAAASEEQLRGIGHNWFGFYSSEHNYFKVGKVQVGQPGLGYPVTFADRDVLSPEESGAICRLVKAEEVPGLASSGSVNLPPSGGIEIARVPVRNGSASYEPELPDDPTQVPAQVLMQMAMPFGYHDYGDSTAGVIGTTVEMVMRMGHGLGPMGVGKSTLVNRQARWAARVGGIMLVEPHFDLTRNQMLQMERRDWRRVFYIEPKELYQRGRAFTLNVMECPNPNLVPELLSLTMLTLKTMVGSKTWDSAPRMQTIMEMSVLTLLETMENPTIRDLYRFINNVTVRTTLAAKVRTEVVREYWQDFFADQKEEKQLETFAPVINRVIKMLMNPHIATIVSSRKSTLNLRRAMDESKLILVNLMGAGPADKGGDPAMSFIGLLLVMQMRLAASSRGDIEEKYRRPFQVFLDEGHLFVTPDIAKMYTELRKFRVSTTLLHQTTDQLPDEVFKVVMKGVGNRVCFRAEAGDAKIMAEQALGGQVTAYDLRNLANQYAYMRLMHGGSPMKVCRVRTFAPAPETTFDYPPADLNEGRDLVRAQYPAASESVTKLLGLVEQHLSRCEAAYRSPNNRQLQNGVVAAFDLTIAALVKASASDFESVQHLQAQRDHALADWLAAHPGACSDQVELIKQLSHLDNTLAAVLVSAEAQRQNNQQPPKPEERWET